MTLHFICVEGVRKTKDQCKKKTFAIKTDSSGREYVYQQIDEYDNNHRDAATPDDTVGDGRMYARVDDPLCPVY